MSSFPVIYFLKRFMDPIIQIGSGFQHSCYPNSFYNSNDELVTMHHLVAGEKITVDFSTLFIGGTELFRCNCGFNGCRGSIRGFDQLPVIIQDKYLKAGAVSKAILLKIKL
jgi:hypothetical protein